jgi:hypothetical protein
VPIFVKLECTGRSNFASEHLAAAEYFNSIVVQIEKEVEPNTNTFAPRPYNHCWHASVVFAVMAMEANIYDIMAVQDRQEISPIPTFAIATNDDFRKPLIERYGLVYQAITGHKLQIGSGLGQAARALVLLRDEITHYKTEWRNDAKVSKRLEKQLRSYFTLNPYCCGNVFFPEQCISANSSTWAVRTAREFIVHFAERTGVRLNV